MDAFYELIRGFTWMYTDILQLIDPASLGHWEIHCGGEVFEECSSTFLLIFAVSFSDTLGFPLLVFPLASGTKEVKQVLKTWYHHWGLPSFLEGNTSFPSICRRDRNPHTAWLSANQMWEVSTLQLGHWAWGPQLGQQVGWVLTWLLVIRRYQYPNGSMLFQFQDGH